MLDAMARAWTDREYEKVAGRFAEEMFYSDPLNYSFSRRDDLLKFFREDDGLDQECIFHNAVFDEKDQLGAAEYTYRGTHTYHGTVWIKIEDELIVSWREYQHISDKSLPDFWKNPALS